MVTISTMLINGEPWHVGLMRGVAVIRSRTRTGLILDCWGIGLEVCE